MLAHHRFSPRLTVALRGYDRQRFLTDIGAGLTVGVVALPLAMAFAIASGVKPEQGIFTAIVAGFLISALGGSSVQIGGPAGAFIVVVYGIVQRYGVANLMIATMLAGVVLFAMGWLRLGMLVRQIPVSIVAGFTNGIAVLIALSQVRDFLGLQILVLPAEFFAQIEVIASHIAQSNVEALMLAIACVVGLAIWSALTSARQFSDEQARVGSWLKLAICIPGPIVALVTLSAAATLLDLHVETIGSRFGGIPQAMPAMEIPSFSWSGIQHLFAPTLTIALLGAVESLLCARVADEVAQIKRHDPNQELMAQGIANFASPLFGGIPATGTIARTMANIRAGATSPIAGIVHAATLLAIMLVAAPLAAHVPLAVLAGILLFIAWNMLDLREFTHLRRRGTEYQAKFLSTFILTIVLDLTVAVEVGLALACLLFVYRMGKLFVVERDDSVVAPQGVLVYRLFGSLFFGAAGKIEALGDELPDGVRCLILESHHLASIDSSGLSAIEALRRDLERRGVRLIVCGLHRQPLTELKTATNTQKSSVLLISDLRSALSVADAQLRYQQVNKTFENLP